MATILYILFLLQVPNLSPTMSGNRAASQTMVVSPFTANRQTASMGAGQWTPSSNQMDRGESGLYRVERQKDGQLYKVIIRDSAGKLFMEGHYLDRQMQKPHGSLVYYYSNGRHARINNYVNGVPEGPWIRYYSSGQVLDSTGYVQGRKQGLFVQYHPNGNTQVSGYYDNNQATGQWKQFYASGALSAERVYEQDQLLSIRYHTLSGQVIQEVHTGLIDKKDMVFFDDMLEKENGLQYATYYGTPVKLKKGMIAFTMHTMDGRKAALVHFTDRSLRHKSGPFYKYDEKGQLRVSAHFRENRLDGPFMRWYPNGQLSDSGRLIKDKPEGPWETWYPNGNRKDSGHYVHGLREGLWTVWEEGTQIRGIGLFEQQVRTGEWKFYDPGGKFLYAKRYRNKWKYGETELINIHK